MMIQQRLLAKTVSARIDQEHPMPEKPAIRMGLKALNYHSKLLRQEPIIRVEQTYNLPLALPVGSIQR
jgi:hypothetical protein